MVIILGVFGIFISIGLFRDSPMGLQIIPWFWLIILPPLIWWECCGGHKDERNSKSHRRPTILLKSKEDKGVIGSVEIGIEYEVLKTGE